MTWFTQLAFITMHLRLEQLKALETADLKGNSVPSIKKRPVVSKLAILWASWEPSILITMKKSY